MIIFITFYASQNKFRYISYKIIQVHYIFQHQLQTNKHEVPHLPIFLCPWVPQASPCDSFGTPGKLKEMEGPWGALGFGCWAWPNMAVSCGREFDGENINKYHQRTKNKKSSKCIRIERCTHHLAGIGI